MPLLSSLSSLFLHLLADSWCKRYAVILVFRRLQLLVSFSFQVLFHSLSQGSFHLSLAVLVHYRSELRIQRFEDGTPMFDELLLHLLIFGLFIHSFFRFYRTITFYGLCFIRFQIAFERNISLFFRFRSPLLTKSLLISFPQATKMFQFAWFFSWGFPLLDTCISPFPPYSFRFSRPFVFDLGIHEKPFYFFFIFWYIATWFPFSQYLVAYDVSFLGSECY